MPVSMQEVDFRSIGPLLLAFLPVPAWKGRVVKRRIGPDRGEVFARVPDQNGVLHWRLVSAIPLGNPTRTQISAVGLATLAIASAQQFLAAANLLIAPANAIAGLPPVTKPDQVMNDFNEEFYF